MDENPDASPRALKAACDEIGQAVALTIRALHADRYSFALFLFDEEHGSYKTNVQRKDLVEIFEEAIRRMQ